MTSRRMRWLLGGFFGIVLLVGAQQIRKIDDKVLKSAEVLAMQAKIHSASVPSATPEEFAARIRREVELVGRIVKRAGITPVE